MSQPLRREQDGLPSVERAGELGEDQQVRVQPNAIQSPDRSGDSSPSYLSSAIPSIDWIDDS